MVLTPRVERAGRLVARGGRPAADASAGPIRSSSSSAWPSATSAGCGRDRKSGSGWTRSRSAPSSAECGSVAPLPTDSGATSRYPVRALVANPDGALKPRMAAYVRVLTDPASAATRLFRGPRRWARLLWWRIWS